MKYIVTSAILYITSLFCSITYAQADTAIMKQHLTVLTKTPVPRSYNHINQLDTTAAYIRSIFALYGDSVSVQEYPISVRFPDSTSPKGYARYTNHYQNIICSFGTENTRRIIVGAHYDACEDTEGDEDSAMETFRTPNRLHGCSPFPGADDNASGLTGLLELARMLQGKKLNYRVDLVAYSLEEPPFFGSPGMGSYIHAQSLKKNKVDVYGMVVLEMIGYFREEKNSQKYPIGAMKLLYGTRGDCIGLIKKYNPGKFARKFSHLYKATHTVKTKQFTGPARLRGIDLSDHLNYWDAGYRALMITDTADYRNPNYHKETDTLETLDLKRMGQVIDGVFNVLVGL
jgi:hypothetical protein